MPDEKRKNDIEIRERLVRVEESCGKAGERLTEIKEMLAKHIELDDPIKEQVILNTEHRKTAKNMILALWSSIIGIIATWVTTK